MPKTPRTIVTMTRHFNPNITPLVPQSYSISEHLLTPILPPPLIPHLYSISEQGIHLLLEHYRTLMTSDAGTPIPHSQLMQKSQEFAQVI